MRAVAIEKENGTYSYPVCVFREGEKKGNSCLRTLFGYAPQHSEAGMKIHIF